MTDTRLPESFLTDPRIDNLGDAAFRVYVNGEVYSVSHGTDGALTGRALRFLHPDGPDEAIVRELVEGGLWHLVEGGWEIDRFLTRQTSAAQVEAARENARQRQQRSRERQVVTDAKKLQSRRDQHRDDARDKRRDPLGQDRTVDRTGQDAVTEGTNQLTEPPDENKPADPWTSPPNGEYRGGAVEQW